MNWRDKTVFIGDNLPIMQGMNSESVDLIYLDPPFCTGRNFGEFDDRWGSMILSVKGLPPPLPELIRLADEIKGRDMAAYLSMMAHRLLEMKRLLRETGSIYLHCDPTASHYLKLVMDAIFGEATFRNEIVWRIGWISGYKTQRRGWIRNHDIILYYATDKSVERFNKEYLPYETGYVNRDGKSPTGKGVPIEDTWNCSDKDVLDSIMIKSFSKEKTGYPTQKPLALLERIIKASSNRGEVVFDPFCGCATTLMVADRLQRKWIGIDISEKAAEMVNTRIKKDQGLFADITICHDVPRRTDLERTI